MNVTRKHFSLLILLTCFYCSHSFLLEVKWFLYSFWVFAKWFWLSHGGPRPQGKLLGQVSDKLSMKYNTSIPANMEIHFNLLEKTKWALLFHSVKRANITYCGKSSRNMHAKRSAWMLAVCQNNSCQRVNWNLCSVVYSMSIESKCMYIVC